MDLVIYSLVSGGAVAIDDDGISAFWSGKEPGTTIVERMDGETVLVMGDFDAITMGLYRHIDMRPKKPCTKKGATLKPGRVKNLVELPKHILHKKK